MVLMAITGYECVSLSSTTAYCDNMSAIQIAHNDTFHERSKHIEIDFHYVRQHLFQGLLQLHSIMFHDQLAYLFTKSHSPRRFRYLVSKLKSVSRISSLRLRGTLKSLVISVSICIIDLYK